MKQLFNEHWRGIAIGLAIIAALGIVGRSDVEAAQSEVDEYCKMTALYSADKAAGLSEHDRRGWPEFKKGEVVCQ